MKQFWFALTLLTGSLFISTSALAQDTAPGLMLQQMNQASRSLDYELAFINITKQGVESLRYRHALENQQTLAQLLQMDW